MVRILVTTICVAGAMTLAATSTQASGGGGGGGGGGGTPSSTAPNYDIAQEYQKGAMAMQAGDYKAAEKSFARVTSVVPNAADAWFSLGLARIKLNDAKGARKAFEKAVKYNPESIPGHAQLGMSLAALGETAKAQAELDLLQQRATTCAGTCPDARTLKAAVDMVQAAVSPPPAPAAPAAGAPATTPGGSAALDLLFVDPATGDASYGQAIALINQKKYGEALGALERASQAFGPHPDVLTYIGYTHRKMGESAVAEGYYRQALALAPDHRGALEYYGELKVEEGDIPAAKLMLAHLERLCAFGCEQAEELQRWIDAGGEPR